MYRYILKRLLSVIPVFICISLLLFGIVNMMPGDQVRMMLPNNLRAEQYDAAYNAMYIRMGLDRPWPEQYLRWMGRMFQGDFGHSSGFNRPVSEVIWEPMRNTLYLNIFVIILQFSIMIPVGIQMAKRRLRLFDNSWSVFSLVAYSMPSFFISIILIYVLSLRLGWFPPGGMPNAALLDGFDFFFEWLRRAALPAIALTLISIASGLRYVRNAMIDSLSQDYVRTARAKGLSERTVVYSHAFRNALIPFSTVAVSSIFACLIGAPATEMVFAWNGIGRLLITSLNARDFMLVMTVNWIFAIMIVIGNLVADIVYGLIDPRIKLS